MSGLKVCVVTGSRAEFGQLLPLLRGLDSDPYFDLALVVTGAHLSGDNKKTLDEIEESGIPISEKIPIQSMTDTSREGVSIQLAEVVVSFTHYFSDNRPDILIVIGDRYEIFGVGIAASTLLIPICHICGGSTTAGALDEIYRHSLTKMSSIHFTTCETYRKRVIQLGEDPHTVFNVGSLAIENCLNTVLLSKEELLTQLEMDFNRPYCVVTFHPVTTESTSYGKELYELIHAFDSKPEYQYLITLSNSDYGGSEINEIWKSEKEKRDNLFVVSSLGMKRYLTALKYSEMMIGNSSSGTTEGPAMKIPVIDIGDRQKGRVFSECAIHCELNEAEIVASMEKASGEEFRQIAKKVKNPFGDGTTSKKMINILKSMPLDAISVKKEFYDVNYEVTDEEFGDNTGEKWV